MDGLSISDNSDDPSDLQGHSRFTYCKPFQIRFFVQLLQQFTADKISTEGTSRSLWTSFFAARVVYRLCSRPKSG